MEIVSTVSNTPVTVTLLIAGGHQCTLPPMDATDPTLKQLLTSLTQGEIDKTGLFEMLLQDRTQALYVPGRNVVGMLVSPPVQLQTELEQPLTTYPSPSGFSHTCLQCVRITQETAIAKTISFSTDSAHWFNYQPGQQLVLGADLEGTFVTCPYFIVSSPTRPHTIDITIQRIKREWDAAAHLSNWFYDHLQVGSQVTACDLVSGPFACSVNSPDKVVLISDGIGITSLISLVRWVYDTATPMDIVFVHSASTLNTILFRQELVEFSCRMPNFRLAVTITDPIPGQVWMGYRGPITASLLHSVTNDLSGRVVYACGNDQFLETIATSLQVNRFPMEHYHTAPLRSELHLNA